jgi:hypothetical protein
MGIDTEHQSLPFLGFCGGQKNAVLPDDRRRLADSLKRDFPGDRPGVPMHGDLCRRVSIAERATPSVGMSFAVNFETN